MSRFLAITLFSLLWAVGLTQAAAADTSTVGTAAAGTAVVRIDNLVILNGTSLLFDPLDGYNETTASPAWQEDYIDALDLSVVYHIFTEANKDLILRSRGELMIAVGGADCVSAYFGPRPPAKNRKEKRRERDKVIGAGRLTPVTQLRCMIHKLVDHIATGRWPAFEQCHDDCQGVTYQDLRDNTRQFWLLAGIGVYAAGNFLYDTWMRYGW